MFKEHPNCLNALTVNILKSSITICYLTINSRTTELFFITNQAGRGDHLDPSPHDSSCT